MHCYYKILENSFFLMLPFGTSNASYGYKTKKLVFRTVGGYEEGEEMGREKGWQVPAFSNLVT